jgi:signal transduction histidine kinase
MSGNDRLRGRYARAGRETGFLLVQLPLAIAAFVLAVLVLSAGVPLLVLVVGVVVLAGLLAAVNALGELTRRRLDRLGHAFGPGSRPRQGRGGWWRRSWRRATHGQSWMDVIGALLGFPVAILGFSLGLSWWVGAAGGLTFWFWGRWLPPDDNGLADLLGLPTPEWVVNAVLGAIMLLVAPWVIRGLVLLQVGVQRLAHLPTSTARLRGRIDDLTASRAAVVDAEAQALRRIERDLHDGPQQRLVRTTMDVQTALRRIDAGDPEAAREYLSSALEQVASGLGELRTMSRGIAPPVLADRGLAAAVSSLAGQSPIPVEVQVVLPEGRQHGLPRETAAYYVVSEALANAGKHSGASGVQVRVDVTASGALRVRVSDDGRGGAHPGKGHGLAGLADRLAGVDGTLEVVSPDGGGTTVHATIPAPSS